MKELKDENIESLLEHGARLSNIKYVLDFYVYCLNNSVYSESIVEIYCVGNILREYVEKTKDLFNSFEHELNI